MESTERLVRTWMASPRDEEVSQIVEDISSGKSTLLSVVKVSGEYLTSEEHQIRSKGIELLSLILSRLPPNTLNRPTTRTLVNFYCDKLEDADTIIPALDGLYTLARLPTFGGVEATTTIESIFRHVNTKTLTQSHRFKVYSIVDSLIASHRDVLKSMGLKFLDGYIALVDGEKDPRNLLVVFAMDRVILIEFDVSERVQTFYDVVFCYFPISFRPPPNNPGGITADDLRRALRKCVSATPQFGTLAIPHFLDNLVSGSRPAKRDTLETLTACLPVYGPAIAQSFARKLWNSLKLEVFQPVDKATEEHALIAIQALIKTIYSSDASEPVDKDIQGLAREACEECVTILREPEKTQAKAATRVLCSFMTTTPSVTRYTVAQVVTHLTKLFINPDEVTSRPATLILLAEVIEAARDSRLDAGGVLLAPYKDEVLGALSSALKTHNLRLPALTGLKGLITTEKLLSTEEIGFVVHGINEIIQDHPDQFEDISDGILELLSTISEVAPSIIVDQTLPLFFGTLPDYAPPRDAVEERAQSWKTLDALQTLCKAPLLFETLVIRLTTKLELMCSPTHTPDDSEPTAAYAHAILRTLANTLAAKVQRGDVDVPKYVERLVSRLFNLFVYSALEYKEKPPVAADTRLLEVGAEVVTLVVTALPKAKQEVYLKSVFLALEEGKVSPISEGHFKLPSDARVSPLQSGASRPVRNLLALYTGAVIPAYKDIDFGISDTSVLSKKILNWLVQEADTDLQRTSAMHLISVIVNRKAAEVSPFFQELSTSFWPQEILDPSRPLNTRQWALSTWAWVAKAILVQNHGSTYDFATRIFDVFGDETINWHAAKAIGIIPGHDGILTKQNHAVLKILFAQKYVNRMLPKTIEGAKDDSDSVKQLAYLVALSSLIKSTPKATYANELPSLIPLLIRGLDLPDPEIRNNVIETFLAAAEGDSPDKSLVSEHASTLIHAMLKNCIASEMPSPKVRISALRYLGRLPGIVKSQVLTRYKSEVIKELEKALDDPKRSVRKEAVDARTHWFKYSG